MNWICQREYKWREVELGLIPELLLYLRQRCVLCAEVLCLLGPKDDSTEMARFSELISCVILAFKPFPWLPLAVEPNWVSYCVPSHIAFSVPLGAVTFLLLEINSPKESKPFVSINFSSFSLESSALTITLSKVCHPCIH